MATVKIKYYYVKYINDNGNYVKSAVCPPPVVVFLQGWNASQQPIYVYENKARNSLESFSRECV